MFCAQIPPDISYEPDWGHEGEFTPDPLIEAKLPSKKKPRDAKKAPTNTKLPPNKFKHGK